MGEPVMGRRVYGPIGDFGDVVLLLNGAEGPINAAPFRQIAYYERIDFYGVHGLVEIWRHAADPAPFVIDGGGVTGVIAAGKSTAKIIPASLKFPDGNTDGLAQIRMRLRPIALGGPAPQDLDVFMFHPAGLQNWVLASNSASAGAMNMRNQFLDPGDVAQAPAQGAAIAIAAEIVSKDPWESAPEVFVIGNQGPAFIIQNNGNADTNAGALGLECSIIRYVLNPLDNTEGAGAVPVAFLDKTILVPRGVDWTNVRKVSIAGSSR